MNTRRTGSSTIVSRKRNTLCPRFEQMPNNLQVVHYNNILLPVYAAHEVLSEHPDHRLLMHWHPDIELVHVRSDHFTYFVDSQNFEMESGDFVFVNARHLHGIECIDSDDWDYSVVLIDPSILTASAYITRSVIAPLLDCKHFPCILRSGRVAEPFTRITEQIIELCANEQDAYELQIVSITHDLLHRLVPFLRHACSHSEDWNTDRYLHAQRNMLTYIAEHYQEKNTLEELAETGHVSISTCNRLFRQYLQQTTFTHLIYNRLDTSSRDLIATDLSIAEIAQSCSLSHQSYYCRQFQKRYGISPLQYRRRFKTAE